jgi:hypothetical protein
MSYQERIYGQCGLCPERNKTTPSVNMSSDIYVFNRPFYDVSGATKIDCTLPPNSGLTSGDTAVYIISSQTGITFDFIFTANTQSFTDLNQSKFNYGVYKYNFNTSSFNREPVYNSDIIEWSTFSATSVTTQRIPINEILLDGDYIIKGNFNNKVSTEFGLLLNQTYNTELYIDSDEYGIYQSDRDFYFVAIQEAETPQINQGVNSVSPIGSFVVDSFELQKGQTNITISNELETLLVSLNGVVLAENYDYIITTITGPSIDTKVIQLFSPAVIDDILTITYISEGFTNDIITKVIDITTPIISGSTNNQGLNSVYYNTRENKYELYVDTTPLSQNDILVTVNGAVLANNIDYYQSISNPKRIILNGSLFIDDIVNIYYNGFTNLVGEITTPTPSISWSINQAPVNTDGIFVVEVSSATTFTSLVFSGTVKYILGQFNYGLTIPITGNYGDELYYRVKNEKQYKTLCGSVVKSEKYSEIIPIKIGISSLNNY